MTTRETYTQFNIRGKEINALVGKQRALDERRRDNVLLAVQASQKSVGEFGTGIGHGKSSTSSTVLRLDDFITTKLDTVNKGLILFARHSFTIG